MGSPLNHSKRSHKLITNSAVEVISSLPGCAHESLTNARGPRTWRPYSSSNEENPIKACGASRMQTTDKVRVHPTAVPHIHILSTLTPGCH